MPPQTMAGQTENNGQRANNRLPDEEVAIGINTEMQEE